MTEAARKLNELREEALAAARGLSSGESALAGVLRDLEQERSRAAQAYHAVVRSLAAALEARDGYTGEHSDDVHDLSVAVAERLGLDAQTMAEVEAVALLHDVGKIGVPDHVLHKPGPLTPDEWALMREHPVIGERILRPLPGLSAVAKAVRHEHERWDGGGYPDGLAGSDIPLASRIVLACDTYHALVSDRPYRAAMSVEYAIGELRGGSGTQFDPVVVDAVLWCVSVEGGVTPREAGADDVARALIGPDHARDDGRSERELHALLAIASAVGAAHRLEDVVELAAEAACEALDAASLSISRWEVQRRVLRTLVNVGDLAPGEERRPVDEVYRLEGDDLIRELIEDGRTYVYSAGDPDLPAREEELLLALGKAHAVGVAIMLGGKPWGELWATRTADQPAFDERDVRFLQTVAGQIAAAAGRAEVFSRMAELAFEDGLTGVANRRALDERLELALSDAEVSGRDLAVLLCDVDNLKELNDLEGHAAGDEALARVAAALRTAVASAGREASSLVARAGGDEFCVLLEDASAEEAQAVGERVLVELAAQAGPSLTVSCGVASLGLGAERGGDLLRAADAAQYTAKRTGRARVCVADSDMEGRWKRGRAERRAVRGTGGPGGGVDVGPVLAYTLEALDGPLAAAPALDRLEAVTAALAEAVDATAVGVSWRAPDGDLIEAWYSHDRRTGGSSGRRFGTRSEDFAVTDYPASARLLDDGGVLLVEADDPAADPAERRLLDEYGMSAVLAAGLPEPDPADGAWLVEIYADARTKPLALTGAALRLLGAEAVRGAPARVRSSGR